MECLDASQYPKTIKEVAILGNQSKHFDSVKGLKSAYQANTKGILFLRAYNTNPDLIQHAYGT